MTTQILAAVIRHALSAAGVLLLGDGVLDGDTLSTASGALTTLAMLGWSIWQKLRR